MAPAWEGRRLVIVVRDKVLWFGPGLTEPIKAEFEERSLFPAEVGKDLKDDEFKVSRAAVFGWNPTTLDYLRNFGTSAVDHGLTVVLTAAFREGLFWLDELAKKLLPVGTFHPVYNQPAHAIPEIAARHDPGRYAQDDLEIDCSFELSATDRLLLRRAFNDSASLHVEKLHEGKSGALVVAVHAVYAEAEKGPYPLPHFAKLDARERIQVEHRAYEEQVARYIPFSQRPNCEPTRCLYGSSRAILVGDFVDGSSSLGSQLQSGSANGTLHSLFDDALAGWRRNVFAVDKKIRLQPVRESLFRPAALPPSLWAAARRAGARRKPATLAAKLDEYQGEYREGIVHGDLNAENVRVRRGEAILIDFYKTTYGAIASDLAALETAMSFTYMAEVLSRSGTEGGAFEESDLYRNWKESTDALFSFEQGAFLRVPPVTEAWSSFGWLWDATRQLRLMAHYIDGSETSYAYLLALQLLRVAMYAEPGKESSPEFIVRRDAYVAADRLVTAVTRL
ncbi:MAG: phosphotransferase [Armatimonadetes bacterium]|nr:phosphotransferase [Armatimonadota bacterium]